MTRKRLFTLLAAVASLTTSCSGPRATSDLSHSVNSIRRFVDSFKGLSMEEARDRLAKAKLSEEAWEEGGFGGEQLVATFTQCEVRIFFSEAKAIITSVQVLSK